MEPVYQMFQSPVKNEDFEVHFYLFLGVMNKALTEFKHYEGSDTNSSLFLFFAWVKNLKTFNFINNQRRCFGIKCFSFVAYRLD